MEETLGVTTNPISWISWILALPIRGLAAIISFIRERNYDPEEAICPACGFRGDDGTAGKTCRIHFVATSGIERGAIQHTCFRCNADYFSHLFRPAEHWLPKQEDVQAARIKQVARRLSL